MFPRIFWQLLILEIVILGGFSKRCKKLHFQYYYCSYPIVLKLRLTRGNNNTGPYRMQVKAEYKNDCSLNTTEGRYVYVNTIMNMTGKENNRYVVFGTDEGKRIATDNCTKPLWFNKLNIDQARGFLGNYNIDCSCAKELKNTDFTNFKKCEYLYASSRNTSGNCVWHGSHRYTNCKNRRDAIENKGRPVRFF